MSSATEQAPKCTEQCKLRRRELEAETRQLRRDNRHYEDRVRSVERELQVGSQSGPVYRCHVKLPLDGINSMGEISEGNIAITYHDNVQCCH